MRPVLRQFATLAACAIAVAGCGLPLAGKAQEVANTCSTTEECGPASACVAGACASTKAALADLVLQIDLPSTSSYGANTTALVELDGMGPAGEMPGGFVVSLDVDHPGLVELTAAMTLAAVPAGCATYAATKDDSALTGGDKLASDGSLPFKLVLQPSDAPRGLPLSVYERASQLEVVTPPSAGVPQVDRHRARAVVPAGRYEIYAVPRIPNEPGGLGEGCFVPPTLLLDQVLADPAVTVSLSVGEPQHISGTFAHIDLYGYTLDLVDNDNGRLISTSHVFGPATPGVPSAFDLVTWSELRSLAILRLTPPASTPAMPVVIWDLDAADLDGDNIVDFDLGILAGEQPVLLQGAVLDEASAEPVGANVIVQSLEFAHPIGQNQAYKTSIATDAYGNFELSLLPGTYLVSALPSDAALGLSQQELVLGAGSLPGHTFVVRPKPTVSGFGTTSAGPASGIAVSLQPSVTPRATFSEDLLGTSVVVPGSATSTTGYDGGFAIAVDAGVFDLSLRPSSASGFPWLVRSRLTVLPEQVTSALGELRVSNPVVVEGVVRAPGGTPLPGAQIRAWLPVIPTGQNTKETVIAVGETTAGPDGRYRLSLPPSGSQ